MPRIRRSDDPGSWHHVWNRAIGRRTLFETRQDFRVFLMLLALECRRGTIEVHAFCLMHTHFHLLVRSPKGRLAEAMQRVQLGYSRWFNRSRGRDGSLVRGRYMSKRVCSQEYRRILVRYIDHNPISAGLVERACDYPWGSAWYYSRSRGPRWLERSWVESEVHAICRSSCYSPADYAVAFGAGEGLAELVEGRLRHDGEADDLDDLMKASSEYVRRWLQQRSLLADGTAPGLPVLSLRSLDEVLERERSAGFTLRGDGVDRTAAEVARVGLARDLCGQRIAQIARHVQVSEGKVRRLYELHRREVQAGGEYALWVAELARAGLDRLGGGRRL